MKKIKNYFNYGLFIIFLIGASINANAMTHNKLKIPGVGGGGSSSSKVDLKGGKTELVKLFFEFSNNFLEAQELLLKAYGKNQEAGQVAAALKYAKNSNYGEADRMKNSIQATTEASKAVEASINDKSIKITAEGKALYAKAIPATGKGLLGTIKLRPKAQQMVTGIQSNPMSAVSEIGGLAKIIPNIPSYITTMFKTTKLIATGAKANDIKGVKDLEFKLGDI